MTFACDIHSPVQLSREMCSHYLARCNPAVSINVVATLCFPGAELPKPKHGGGKKCQILAKSMMFQKMFRVCCELTGQPIILSPTSTIRATINNTNAETAFGSHVNVVITLQPRTSRRKQQSMYASPTSLDRVHKIGLTLPHQ